MSDIFFKYLNEENKHEIIQRALTDKSYKDVYREKNHEEMPKEKCNFELATYGDAILKMCLMRILIDKVSKPTEEKKKYESDRALVKFIASKYKLNDRIHLRDDLRINDYNYDDHYKDKENKKKGNKCKYIATCVEAMVAAIYMEEKSLDPLVKLIEEWKKLIDDASEDIQTRSS